MTSSVAAEESSQRLRMEFGPPLVGDTELHFLQRLCAGPIPGPSVHLGLLVAGAMMHGQLAAPEDFGSHLDTSLRAIADRGTSGGDRGEEAPSAAPESVRHTALQRLSETDFRRRAERWRMEDERVEGALQAKEDEIRRLDETLAEGDAEDDVTDVHELPDHAIMEEYERWRKASVHLATEPVLTLANATVLTAGRWVAVGMVRVLVREVGAWWLGDARE